MARKPSAQAKAKPVSKKEKLSNRGFALRKAGFRDEKSYERWIQRYSSLPQNDPRYYDKNIPVSQREAEIKRIKRIIRRSVTPAKEIRRKANVLVYDLHKMSAFAFSDKYKEAIQAMLQDPKTSRYDKAILRDILRKLEDTQSELPEALRPGEQGELFR